MSPKHTPGVSIGMPVYNGEKFVARAITSLLNQTYTDFELIVSDNASTDQTEEIVRTFAAVDGRVRYIRQASNIGAVANFGMVLNKAKSSYFMWAASDDHWAPEFLDQNLNFLESHPDYVASISRAVFDDTSRYTQRDMGTFPLSDSVEKNVRAFLLEPGTNTRFYALYRTAAIRHAWVNVTYWASDWAIVCRILAIGKYHELPNVLMFRSGHGGSSNAYQSIRRFNAETIDHIFPYRRFTLFALTLPSVRRSPRMWWHLIYLNLDSMLMMLRNKYFS